jgi:hypothetical protein
MKVSELKKALENINDDFDVVLEVKLDEDNGMMISASYENVITRENNEDILGEDEIGLFVLGSIEIIG